MVDKILGFAKRVEPETDPVCHMKVDPKNPPGGKHDYNGKTYYFCGPGCRVRFSKDPEPYLRGEKGGHM
jgi:Cu+-exporting ATPase